jgi:hypothetical protein
VGRICLHSSDDEQRFYFCIPERVFIVKQVSKIFILMDLIIHNSRNPKWQFFLQTIGLKPLRK